MKQSVRAEFDKITSEAYGLFGTAHLSFLECPTSRGWTLYINYKINMNNGRPYEMGQGVVYAENNTYTARYGIWTCSVQEMLVHLHAAYKTALHAYKNYINAETEKLLEAL